MKEKRKGQPDNLKRYWLIFGLLAIVLLIPFRLVGYWMVTNVIYVTISVAIGVVLERFVRRYGWKRWIVALMLICVMLPIFQLSQITYYASCDYPAENSILVCRTDCPLVFFLVVPKTSIGIQISPYPFSTFGAYVCANTLW